MIVLGITGGIGAGKSAAVDAFVRRGAAAFSADAAVHELYRTDEVREAVVSRWGERVLAADGSVDRAAIAGIVFADTRERQWLEGLLHPLVAREWLRFVEAQKRLDDPPPMIVAEVPLLFEAGLDRRYDQTVLVTAPLETRLRRVGERAAGASGAAARAEVQMSEEQKARRADFVFDNVGSRQRLDAFVEQVWAEVLSGGAATH